MYLIANLAGNRNNIETYHDNRDRVEGPATTGIGGEERRGTLSHGQVTCDLSCQVQCDLRL